MRKGDILKKLVIINFIKGIFIGMGAVLPGLSGGVLATVFGIYQPLINFIANLKKDFKANVKFFLPVAIGGLCGIFILAHGLNFLLTHNFAEVSSFFVGCLLGIFPALTKQAAAFGRKPIHLVLTVFVALFSFLLLTSPLVTTVATSALPISTSTWVFSGGLIGLGITLPGLSPSNFLLYLNLYQPLSVAISSLNFGILIPVALGMVVTVILTAKLIAYLLTVLYPVVFHMILGLVLTSTVMIVPREFESNLVMALCLIAGIIVGMVMNRLETQAKHC